jgi:hypothetical protein
LCTIPLIRKESEIRGRFSESLSGTPGIRGLGFRVRGLGLGFRKEERGATIQHMWCVSLSLTALEAYHVAAHQQHIYTSLRVAPCHQHVPHDQGASAVVTNDDDDDDDDVMFSVSFF